MKGLRFLTVFCCIRSVPTSSADAVVMGFNGLKRLPHLDARRIETTVAY